MDEPVAEDTLTVDELISRLEEIRLIHGGEIPVVICDFEPVCRAVFREGTELCPGEYVIITDRFGQPENLEDLPLG